MRFPSDPFCEYFGAAPPSVNPRGSLSASGPKSSPLRPHTSWGSPAVRRGVGETKGETKIPAARCVRKTEPRGAQWLHLLSVPEVC